MVGSTGNSMRSRSCFIATTGFELSPVTARGKKQGEAKDYPVEWVTSLAEIYRENKEYELLAIHYNAIGNSELRDKYIDLALKQSASDDSICFLRALQDRPDLIPNDVIDRRLRLH